MRYKIPGADRNNTTKDKLYTNMIDHLNYNNIMTIYGRIINISVNSEILRVII